MEEDRLAVLPDDVARTGGSHARQEVVIRPTTGWLDVDLLAVWRHRDLLYLLVYREFASKYRQTVLGPLWFILQPLMTSVIFAVVFGGVARIPTAGVPPLLFYLTGLLGWTYFSQTFQTTATTFVANANLFGKVYFPRLVVPLSSVIANFLAFGLQLAVLIAFWIYFKFATPAGHTFGLDGSIIWFPLLVLQLAIVSLGCGLWLSALTTKYRDLVFLVPFLIQTWMYATPIIYPLSQVPEKWQWVAALNPMTAPTEALKQMFLGSGQVTPSYIAISVGVTLAVLLSGVFIFNRVEKTVVDTL